MRNSLIGFLLFLCAVATVHAETIKLPLQKFTPLPAVELRCVSGSHNISIPVPERWNVRSMTLSLRYTVSSNLIGDISQLVVKINGEPIAQTKLNPLAPDVQVSISIPVAKLKPGYNTLTFQVAQHYSRQQCEPICAPDLWTNISMGESFLQVDYDLKPLPLNLGEAAGLVFDPKQFPEAQVNIITDDVTADTATLATIVASGIARRFDYRKVTFTLSHDIKPGMDNVLVGPTRFANNVLAKNGITITPGSGGLLKIFHLPTTGGGSDPLHALLVITGDKRAAISIAAKTLANMSLPYPGTEEMRAYEFSMPDIAMYSGRQVLASDKPYDFKTLNLPTYSFQGLDNNAATINFRLPPDFLIKQNQYAKISLNFSYGAGLRADSTLNVFVNGKPLRSVHLDSPSGGYFEAYKIEIPTYLFKPGVNTISFTPYLNTARQLCDAAITDGLFVTIYENSTLYFPPMPHFVEMPKLELFALNGFPFTRWPDGFETLVYLPKPTNASVATALNVVGMITQKNGFPLFGTQITYSEPKEWAGEMLVIGKVAAIPKSIMGSAPMKLGDIAQVPYPVVRSWNDETSIAFSRQKGDLGRGTGALMEFESPSKKGRSVLLLTADTDEDLLTTGKAMLEPDVQSRAAGDVLLLEVGTNATDYKVTSLTAGKKYTTGNKGDVSLIDSFLYANPYVFYGLIAFAIVALALIGYWQLRRFRAKRTKAANNATNKPPQ